MTEEKQERLTGRQFINREIKFLKNEIKKHQTAIDSLRDVMKYFIELKKQVKK